MTPAGLPQCPEAAARSFAGMWADLIEIGRHPSSGGYRRFSFEPAELSCREWFVQEAARRAMSVEVDRNGNLWAATVAGVGPAIVTGSHLDSVFDGGAFDGPLGIVAGFAALDALAELGRLPLAPVGIVAFVEEEGARFGVPCLGSRLLTGAAGADRARGLRDASGADLGSTMRKAGIDPGGLGPEPQRLVGIRAFLELHVEQGRGLVHSGHAVAVGGGLRPHGRWRLDLCGRADHAGTTALADRADPMLAFAHTVLATRAAAARAGAVATVGRASIRPGATNVIPHQVSAWLDVRAGDEPTVRAVLADLLDQVRAQARLDDVEVCIAEESFSPRVELDAALGTRIAARLRDAPMLDTGAGHDAGILAAAGVPTAMLFVRNPTGVSHAPAEHAEVEDCLVGVAALAEAIAECGQDPG